MSISFLSEPCNCNESGARARVHATAVFQHETFVSRKDGTRNTVHDARLATRSEPAQCDAMRCDAMRYDAKKNEKPTINDPSPTAARR